MGPNRHWSVMDTLPPAGPDNRHPAVAVIDDSVHAVWVSDSAIHHSWLQDGRWQQPARIASGQSPAAAATPDGRLHCVFMHHFLGNDEIYHVSWDGRSWSLPQVVSRTSGRSTDPALSAAPDGQLHAAWADTTPGRSTIYLGAPAASAWSNGPIPNGFGSRPAIASDAEGRLFVAWQDRSSEQDRFEVFCSVNRGGEWSLPLNVSDNPERHSLMPRIAVNRDGECHLVWQEEQNGAYAVRDSEYLSEGWGQVIEVSAAISDARELRIVSDAEGVFHVVWLDGKVIRHAIHAPGVGERWQMAADAHEDSPGTRELALAASTAGNQLHLIWSAPDGAGRHQLHHARQRPMSTHNIFVPIAHGPG